MVKHDLRIEAIRLREDGLSYSEIQRQVPVSKSTLSRWLRSVKLTEAQRERLRKRCARGRSRAAIARRRSRRIRQRKIYQSERRRIGSISPRELWLIGTALYWAEGTKEKRYRPGSGIKFANSDPMLIRLFLRWIRDSCEIHEDRIQFSIYVHEDRRQSVEAIRAYWAHEVGSSPDAFHRVYYKSNRPTSRRNKGRSYFGLLRVEIKASSTDLRKVTGWMLGIDDWLDVPTTAASALEARALPRQDSNL